MAVLSGSNGTLFLAGDQVRPVAHWRLVVTSANIEYVANDTGGWKKRLAAVRDSAGWFEVAAEEGGQCPVAEGDAVALNLHVDKSGANYYAVPAVVDKIEVDVDIAAGRIIAYVVAFSGNGAVAPHGIVAKTG